LRDAAGFGRPPEMLFAGQRNHELEFIQHVGVHQEVENPKLLILANLLGLVV
jgi:hypothetical protein